MLSDATPLSSATASSSPKSRQHRLEATVAHAISIGRPRSVVREAVERLVDQLHWQGIAASEAVATVVSVASRATASSRAIDGRSLASDVFDYVALAEGWASARSARAD